MPTRLYLYFAVGCITSIISPLTLFAAHTAHTTLQLPSTLSSLTHISPSPDNPKTPRKKSSVRPATPKTSDAPFRDVKLIPVVVISSGRAPNDSVATIIQRDLMYGDKISPIVISETESINDPSDISASQSATFAVRLTQTSAGLNVELQDITTHSVRQSEHFTIPVVPELRAAQIRDSIARVLSLKAAETQTALARNAFMRDSVYTLLCTKRPKFRRQGALAAWVNDSVTRAAYLDTLTARATALMAVARQDTVVSDAALQSLLARDIEVRDSLQREARWALHGVADEIHLWITGERGVAQTRITYVQDGLVRVVDFDGANDRAVTRQGHALSPAWHPDGHSIVFSDMSDGGTQIAEVNIFSGHTRLFRATPRGMNITPVYTHDGKSVIYAHSMSGTNTELVMMNLTDSAAPVRRIAPVGYDNLSPSLNPDGSRIAFISSRPRTPQIYSVNLDGSEEQLETPVAKGRRSYRTSPDWSPDGRTIAYEQQDGDFQIWAIDVTTKRTRQLTTLGENEGPTWAPNARHIAFTSTRGGSKVLWVLDTESGRLRQLTTRPGARLAAWSPMIVTRR